MVKMDSKWTSTFRKFIALAYGRGYLTDGQVWGLQDGSRDYLKWFSSKSLSVYKDYVDYFDVMLDGMEVSVRTLSLRTAQGAWGDYLMTLTQAMVNTVEKWLNCNSRHGLYEHDVYLLVRHRDFFDDRTLGACSAFMSDDGMKNMLAKFDRLDEGQSVWVSRKIADNMIERIRAAEEGDIQIIALVFALGFAAFAFWQAEQWRYTHGEHGDMVSDNARSVFRMAYQETGLRIMNSSEFLPCDSVFEALELFTKAYKYGADPFFGSEMSPQSWQQTFSREIEKRNTKR